tara:strand:- start:299 stop:1951 length:1653 start_codon:yes stop_codon:yes gene_type:complete
MSELVSALNMYNSKQLGENLHYEYKWNINIDEKIVQLYFQLVRLQSKESINNLADNFMETFISAKNKDKKILLLKILLNTRDIIDGKGEKAISFAILHKLSFVEPNVTKVIIKSFVISDTSHPIGSWADIKNMWHSFEWTIDFERFFIKLINDQLKKDIGSKNISLVAKWIPRETNKHKHLFKKLAESYYEHYIISAKSNDSIIKAKRKAYTNYKRIVTDLSKKLDVTQIKQCGQRYKDINYNNVTSITMSKQKNAFLNKKEDKSDDRIQGAKNFKDFIDMNIKLKKEFKGKRVSNYDFIKDAVNYNNSTIKNKDIENILNSQWKDSEQLIKGNLGNFIPMVDTSGSMEIDNCIPLYNAIGLGIRVAEKSILGKRILSFNTKASWINLEEDTKLTDMVGKIMKEPWGMNTDFMAALDMILSIIIYKNIHPTEIPKLTLCIFSDMQIDCADREYLNDSFWEDINRKYYETGMIYYGVPFNTPNILFWNMRSTKGFPVISKQKNVSMLSGFSPVLLNTFCNKGYNELEKINSYDMLLSILNKDRYVFIENVL